MAMRVRANLVMLMVSSLVHGAVKANADEESYPPIELLEFLGQWTDEYGAEIDFELLEETRFSETPDVRRREDVDRSVGDQF